MVRPRIFVQAPPVTPLPYGLLSAALVLDDLTGHAQMGTQYETDACAVAYSTRAACEADVDLTGGVDVHDLPLVHGHPVTLWASLQCAPVGQSDLEDRARDRLRLGEQRAYEQVLAELLPLGSLDVEGTAAGDAVDLTPGAGAVHPVDGLALLEGYAGQHYGGVPTVHVPRRVGALLASGHVIERFGARLETVQGATVASGGGYYDLHGPAVTSDVEGQQQQQVPAQAAASEAWMYVTGTVVVRRAPTLETFPLLMDRHPQPSNVMTAMVLRPAELAWECLTAAVRVTLERA